MKLFKKKRVLPVILTLFLSSVIYFGIVYLHSPIETLFWAYFHTSVTIILLMCTFVVPGHLRFKEGWDL